MPSASRKDVLIAGGPADVGRELTVWLKDTYNLEVVTHWEWEQTKQFNRPIPPSVGLVIILTDMISHTNDRKVFLAASRAGVTVVRSVRKRSFLAQQLDGRGFERYASPITGGLPIEVLERELATIVRRLNALNVSNVLITHEGAVFEVRTESGHNLTVTLASKIEDGAPC